MWTALAMTAALAYVPAEQGELTLSHVRPTYGFLGATRKDADDTSRPSRSLAVNRGAAAGLRKNRSVTGPPPIDGAPASASTPAFCEEPSTRREYLEAAHVTRRAPTTTTATSVRARGVFITLTSVS